MPSKLPNSTSRIDAETEENIRRLFDKLDNVEEKAAKTDEQEEVQALDSWEQAALDNPLLGADFLRMIRENAPGNKKKSSKPKTQKKLRTNFITSQLRASYLGISQNNLLFLFVSSMFSHSFLLSLNK